MLVVLEMSRKYPGFGVADISGFIGGQDTPWFWCLRCQGFYKRLGYTLMLLMSVNTLVSRV